MTNSSFVQKAEACLKEVKGQPLSEEGRGDKAVYLAECFLQEALRIQTGTEKKIQKELGKMLKVPNGKAFTTSLTDQCFRTEIPERVADQILFLLKKYGIPRFFTYWKQFQMRVFQWLAPHFPRVFIPLTKRMLRCETSRVILPGEAEPLRRHIEQRRKEGVRVNLNHLGEAILGEEEAKRRLEIYLEDLRKPEVDYISVKISTIYSQIHLLAWEETIAVLTERLKKLYRAASTHLFQRQDGMPVPKFVNLDMEEYRDLHLTVELFKRALDDSEFRNHSAGIVLQAYLPDSHRIQQELTEWAQQRVSKGGAPIKIRIVKGANLAMEQVESSLKDWPQAPYPTKEDVDANYKRMVAYGCVKERAQAAHLGIASHNLFDISYAMLLRAENGVEEEVEFEMLEGMADHMRRAVQHFSKEILLYCPSATEEEFQNAVAYLVRRLDENTAPQNFLRHLFDLTPGSEDWHAQAEVFREACRRKDHVASEARRRISRNQGCAPPNYAEPFENESDTDWAVPANRAWGQAIAQSWKMRTLSPIPLVIGGQEVHPRRIDKGISPADPSRPIYQFSLAGISDIETALSCAKRAQKDWNDTPIAERQRKIRNAAQLLRLKRADLIGAMMLDTGKVVMEADPEVSEAIDFAEYYARSLEELHNLEGVRWKGKGVVLVAPPWNFPCAIPFGCVVASLLAGNSVIFKPAKEAVLVGWHLAQILWEAGISKEVLQFVLCDDDPVGSAMVQDPRVDVVVLTGATATARRLLQLRPNLELVAETGGKNSIIVTDLSDRDLAVKDIIHSAFSHSGQKCSACSLLILEKGIYEDPKFLRQLKDAAASLKVGIPWDLDTKINPLIHPPNTTLRKGLTELEKGESWLLKPRQDPSNPHLWSPGIKMGVREGSFTYQNELFGPVLGVLCARNLEHALQLANGTPYGLTAGLHSLDEREKELWQRSIVAGNCYINRGITGAIVQRQPFGGCKESSFGRGLKAGGPNYLTQLMDAVQATLPQVGQAVIGVWDCLDPIAQKMTSYAEHKDLWEKSFFSYAKEWKERFSKKHDPSLRLGQDNLFSYAPQPHTLFRVQQGDSPWDVLRVIAAAAICGASLEVSGERTAIGAFAGDWTYAIPHLTIVKETEEQLIQRLEKQQLQRVRLLQPPSEPFAEAMAHVGASVCLGKVMAHGRLELLHYLREVSLSHDYHRYGNLGDRENEKRAPLKEVSHA